MNTDDILSEHLELCEATYLLISEENQSLKSEGRLSRDFIERKQEHLTRLDRSLEALKRLNSAPYGKTQETNKLIDRAQKRLMQIFLLDRENERLLKSHAHTSGTPQTKRVLRKPNPKAYTEVSEEAQYTTNPESTGADDEGDAYEDPDADAYLDEADHEYFDEDESDSEKPAENTHSQSILPQSTVAPQRRLHRAYRQHLEINQDIAETLDDAEQL